MEDKQCSNVNVFHTDLENKSVHLAGFSTPRKHAAHSGETYVAGECTRFSIF